MPDQPTVGVDQPRPVVCLTLELEITDTERLRNYARERCRAAWGDAVADNDLGACSYEVLLASREGPPLRAVGLEIVDAHHELVGNGWQPTRTRCAALRNRAGGDSDENTAAATRPSESATVEQLGIGV